MPSKEDIYKTIAAPVEGFLKEKGSKFYAYAYPVVNQNQIETAQDELRSLHSKAGHHCYAFRLGTDGNNFRANDDGEPSGTAGKPILGQIDKFELTDVFIVVARYFGGTLLGTGGLIQAYRSAANEALQNAEIVEKIITNQCRIDFDYSLMAPLMNGLKRLKIDIVDRSFEESAYLIVAIPKSETENQIIKLKANILGISFDQVSMNTKIGGLKISEV